jgi:hypothetical protein
MRNTATIIILSVVATILAFGIGACIAIKPFTAIGLAPILAAISLIIRAIRGRPTHPHEDPKHSTQHSSHAHMAGPTKQPNGEVAPQDLNFQDPVDATLDGILVPRDLTDIVQPMPNLPTAATGQQQATNPKHGNRLRWPHPTRHRHRQSR